MTQPQWVDLPGIPAPPEGAIEAARHFYERMASRRSIRAFASTPVPREVLEWAIRTAGTAPNGANKQPWRFLCVQDPATKSRIRAAAEEEERQFYAERASERWLQDLAPLGTDASKPYLEIAPWLIIVMRLTRCDDGGQVYYGQESVGIALGLLLAALHQAGLATLVHTPSPMRFLREVLDRPENESAFALIPVGYPAEGCKIPAEALNKKPLEDIMVIR